MTALQLCLAGAKINNGNRGVAALGQSVVEAVQAHAPGSRVSVFDDGYGIRDEPADRFAGIHVEGVGVRLSRRWHRPESWARVRLAQAMGGLGSHVAHRIQEADAVLDVSGGDSFTDLYGLRRFRQVLEPKRAALRAQRPLVLLPQTYGPFTSPSTRDIAATIVQSATASYARDPESYARLLELAGPDADVGKLREGVDLAFALRPSRPDAPSADAIEMARADGPLVGVNISGLLHNGGASKRFDLVGDHQSTMVGLVRRLLEGGAKVLFVSHVHGAHAGQDDAPGGPGSGESDAYAIDVVRSALTDNERARTVGAPLAWTVAELKWAISQCEWFVGSRMHATIGALSAGVPAAGYAYSDKTRGVFDTCGMGGEVIDGRVIDGADAIQFFIDAFERRSDTREKLAEAVPTVIDRARDQVVDILTAIRTGQFAASN